MSHRRRVVLAGLAALPFAGPATAQTWPQKPIRLLVPLGAGGTADIVARVIAEEAAKALGQNIVIDNKPGAGGTIASAEAARAAADGYTMLLVSQGTMVFNMGLYKSPGYDSQKDLAPVALTGGVSNVLIVPPSSPFKSVADVIAAARAKPGEITYSSGGAGTSHHMSSVLFELRAGIKLQHVPYRTAPAGILAVMNSEVQMAFYNTPTVLQQIRGDKLRALAVTSEGRNELLPSVPTMGEAGVRDYLVNTWVGFAVPRGTPQPVVQRLNAEFNRAAQLPAVREKMLAQGIELAPPQAPEAVDKLVRDDLALWVPIIKAAGASAD